MNLRASDVETYMALLGDMADPANNPWSSSEYASIGPQAAQLASALYDWLQAARFHPEAGFEAGMQVAQIMLSVAPRDSSVRFMVEAEADLRDMLKGADDDE